MDVLDVTNVPVFDDKITREEEHIFLPYNSLALNAGDEIRIPCQAEDLYTLPSRSYLYIEGSLTKPNGEATSATLTNNAMAFLFDEIRLDMNGITIDRNRNPGISSTMRNYACLNSLESNRLQNAGWIYPGNKVDIIHSNGDFNAIVPLSMLLGFAEDHKELILNSKFELILIRASTSNNSVQSNEACIIKVRRLQWHMPVLRLSDAEKVEKLKIVKSDHPLHVAFRTWELYTQPSVPQSKAFSWNIATTSKLEKPRHVIVGLQTARSNYLAKDCTVFEHCNIRNMKLYLNGECFPYHDMNLDFTNSKIAALYEYYSKFQSSYYGRDNYPLLSRSDFVKHAPLFIIDCSHQPEDVVGGSINLRLELEASNNFPAQTVLYCLIMHDKLIKYRPLTHTVQNII